MPTKPILTKESFSDLTFPLQGIDVSTGYGQQRRNTTPLGQNVRTFEPVTNRARGAQRAGLSKYVATAPGGTALVQMLFTLVGVGYPPPGGVMQTSSSGRVVTLVAVVGGNIYALAAGQSVWVQITSSPLLATSGVILSDSNNQNLYFADGINFTYYSPATQTANTWTPSQGQLPTDSGGNAPRLICTWRGRTVLSGLLLDGQNWFMSAVGDPTNWNYSPFPVVVTQAVAGNSSPLGKVGDVVTCLIPYTDDILIFGGDHTVWMMQGDPMAGGTLILISDAIGMAWGAPWCKGPDGTVYFVSNRTGIYSFQPTAGTPPMRISQQIEQLLIPIDTGANTIRLIWDDRFQGLHVFITPTAQIQATTHFFWEQRAGAWWQDTFANNNLNPLTLTVFDGNTPGDRRPLIGSWDGYVRLIDPAASTDDGTPIASAVVIGPLLTADLDDLLLKDVQAILGESSGSVSYAVFVGSTAEKALASTAVASGTWTAGRNFNTFIRRSGHAVYVKITASNPWAMESIRCRIAGLGKVRRRGK